MMFNSLGRLAAGLGAGVALALSASAPVLALDAVSSSGAMVVNVNECFPDEAGGQICVDAHEVIDIVATPSGKAVYIDNGSATVSYYDASGNPTGAYQSRGRSQSVFDRASDAFQVDHTAYNVTETAADGTTCTRTLQYHFANGQIEFYRPGGTCPPPEP